MNLVITRDADQFAAEAGPFINASLECNVLATVLFNVRERGGYGAAPPLYAYSRPTDGEHPLAVAMRTPPWPMLASGFGDPAAAAELVERWLEQDPELSGVGGEPPTAKAIVAAWRAKTNGTSELEFEEAMHVLTAVNHPPRKPPGRLRSATQADRELLIEWELAFIEDAGMGDPSEIERTVHRRLSDGLQLIWQTDEPVSTVGFTTQINGTRRIGPVYTPPEHRNKGFASAAVAATSQQLLDQGAERCMLYTDLANPVSNRIYANIGYVRFADWEQHRFDVPKLQH